MSTPVDEPDHVHFPTFQDSEHGAINMRTSSLPHEKSSEDEGTVVGDTTYQRRSKSPRHRSHSHLTLQINDHASVSEHRHLQSPSQVREQAHRLDDDLQMLQVEQLVSRDNSTNLGGDLSHSKSMHRSRSRRPEPIDEFDVATNPIHEQTQVYKPPEQPTTNFAKIFIRIHQSSFLVRYIIYITPLVLILLIPLLLGNLLFTDANVGGVKFDWFFIWLEIVWLSLWAGRILARLLPWPIGAVASVFTNNAKKWRDLGKQLELPATLFFWWLAIEVSFLPTMINHHTNGDDTVQPWENSMNKVLVSFFVGATLNFIAKVLIQLIAISFHLRTYADRIELNKFQINSLVKLYRFSKERIQMEDRDFEDKSAIPSGARTPGRLVREAQHNTIVALNRFGDVAGKIAGDFTGREVAKSTHPHQVVLTLLATTAGSQVLARRLYRTFVREEDGNVHSEDLKNAFDNEEEANAAFTMFDKDMNGDISIDELEAVCVEIGRERKSITASLKDLDSVVGKLDDVFMFIVVVIFILVLLSLISASTAGVLTSAGSTVLALSWLFSATAQEFLQSIIFVFVKHPFDVGDRVTIYGNTGTMGRSDDYFVKEISLLYTEFKKMEGHVVQAPNSYLNTLFILNQRRSGGLAEAVPIVIKFGTSLAQIEGLRDRLLEFVKAEKREFQSNILTELREVTEAHSLTLNVIFFYKSNWQNEGLRLARRNKFICALMVTMQELGIEGPRARYPGQKESFPLYMQNIPHIATAGMGHGGTPDNPMGLRDEPTITSPMVDRDHFAPDGDFAEEARTTSIERTPSAARSRRRRGESIAAMGQRVDFSLGASSISAANMAGDVYQDRDRESPYRLPISVTAPTPSPHPDRTGSKRRASQNQSQSAAIPPSIGPQRTDSTAHRFNPLTRITTDSSMARTRSNHRNRFFGRMGRASLERERAAAAGLEGVDEQDMMELGMADIPEQNTPPRLSGANTPAPLDPRSGFVGSAAWRSSTDETIPKFRAGSPLRQERTSSPAVGGVGSPRRVRTDLR